MTMPLAILISLAALNNKFDSLEIIYVDNGFSQVVGGMDEVWVFPHQLPYAKPSSFGLS